MPIEALLRLGLTYIDSSDALVSTCAGREVAALSVVDRRLGCQPVPGLPRLPNLSSAITVSEWRGGGGGGGGGGLGVSDRLGMGGGVCE